MTAWYVYALTGEAARPFRTRRHRIEFVPIGRVHAAIERVEAPPVLSEATLREQHAIVSAVARKVDAVVPARFGAFVGEAELAAIVERRSTAIAEALVLVRGREQMTVRIIGEPESAAPPIEQATSGTDYLEQRRAASSAPFPALVEAIEAAVRSMVAASRVERGQGRVRTSVYHLIDRGMSEAYRAALRSVLLPAVESIELNVSGPWPPFAFAPELLA